MFGPGAPPLEWDEAGAYRRDALEVYYLSHAAQPLSEEQLTEVGGCGPAGRPGGCASLAAGPAWARARGGAAGGSSGRARPSPHSESKPGLDPCAPPRPAPRPPQVYYGGWPEVADEGPQRYGPKAAGWVRVQESWTLRDALARPDHVVPGVPAFFVLAGGTPFRERFLEGDLPLLG